MDPRHLKIDERLKNSRLDGVCVYCGRRSSTRDHVPSKVLLDEPYPDQLPVVPACQNCNQSFSLDEEYLACAIDVALSGTVDTNGIGRPKIRRIMEKNRELRDRLRDSRRTDGGVGPPVWMVERLRVRNVVVKLAKGHVAYEMYANLEEPKHVEFAPLTTVNSGQTATFEGVGLEGTVAGWPELGSRAFLRAIGEHPDSSQNVGGWVVVQAGRYRYAVSEEVGIRVRMLLSDYLACEVLWGS